jgi:hypothetical protein
MSKFRIGLSLFILCAVPLARAQSGADPLIEQAQLLITERNSAAAYALLLPQEVNRAGDPMYDYLLGIAALDSGRAAAAVAPLERVLAAQPGFSGARMEYARALYERGDFGAAGEQFQTLLTQSPPPRTQEVIKTYLEAINRSRGVAGSRFTPSVDFGSGYDSNANGSTAESQFLGFTLNARNVEQHSAFLEAGLGLAHTVALGARSGLASSLHLSHRRSPDAPFVDQSIAALASTWLFKSGETRGSIGFNGFYGQLDGEDHQVQANLEIGLARRFASDWELSGLARIGRVDYLQPVLEIMQVDRLLGGIALTRFNLGDRSGRLGVALIAGHDDARLAGSPYGNDRYGARLYGGMLLRPQSTLYAEMSYQRADFKGGSGFFGVDRRDNQKVAIIGLDIQNWPTTGWSLSPQLRHTQNDSSVSLYEFSRTEAAVFLRRSFR